MEPDNLKMFTCEKYGVGMLASRADETCAKRFAATSPNGSWGRSSEEFDKCHTCKRGAIQYELGKHKTTHPHPRPLPEGEGAKSKGETNMATKEFHKSCTDHGPFTTTGPAGKCPKCKAAATPEKKPAAAKGAKEIESVIPAPSGAIVAGGGNSSGALSIDWTKYPKLHNRLITLALGQVLSEMESKA